MPALSAKASKKTLVAKHMLEHAGEKVGLARGACGCRAAVYAGCGKEGGEPLGLFGDEGKRLNRQHFRRFPRWPWALLHGVPFAFP